MTKFKIKIGMEGSKWYEMIEYERACVRNDQK